MGGWNKQLWRVELELVNERVAVVSTQLRGYVVTNVVGRREEGYGLLSRCVQKSPDDGECIVYEEQMYDKHGHYRSKATPSRSQRKYLGRYALSFTSDTRNSKREAVILKSLHVLFYIILHRCMNRSTSLTTLTI